jgi:hypothetical protein
MRVLITTTELSRDGIFFGHAYEGTPSKLSCRSSKFPDVWVDLPGRPSPVKVRFDQYRVVGEKEVTEAAIALQEQLSGEPWLAAVGVAGDVIVVYHDAGVDKGLCELRDLLVREGFLNCRVEFRRMSKTIPASAVAAIHTAE